MHKDAYQVLAETSRTFFLPIQRLPVGLKDAVAAAYLGMRAIDEIEDDRAASGAARASLLRSIARALEIGDTGASPYGLRTLMRSDSLRIPEVTQRLPEWLELAPAPIRLRVFDSIGAMAERMAHWVERDFRIDSEDDLDRYTYAVAGAVGLLLADLWQWWQGIETDRTLAVGFGRGLQAVNIARNRNEDLMASVNFYPPGWTDRDVREYARQKLSLADRYTRALPVGPIREFCAIPLALAHGTLGALDAGREKLSRGEVEAILSQLALSSR